MKTKPGKNVDLKAKMIKDYLSPQKCEQFKNIDLKRIELEKTIKHMPLSIERMTVQCKNDIAQCETFNELKEQLNKGKRGGRNKDNNNTNGTNHEDQSPQNSARDVEVDAVAQVASGVGPPNDFSTEREKYLQSKLRLKYHPQQLTYQRAIKANMICKEVGFIDKQAKEAAEAIR